MPKRKIKRKTKNPMVIVDKNEGIAAKEIDKFEKGSEIMTGCMVSLLAIGLGLGMLLLSLEVGFRL